MNSKKNGLFTEWNDDKSLMKKVNYKNGKRHGYGTYIFADGRKYIGRFENEIQSGEGNFVWKNGLEFKGTFRNGLPWEGEITDRFCAILALKGFNCIQGSLHEGVFNRFVSD